RKWMATAHRAGPSTWAAATTWSASKLSATLSRMRRADTSSVKRRATTLDGDEACRRASNEAISHWSQGVIHKLVYLIHKLRRPRSTDFLTLVHKTVHPLSTGCRPLAIGEIPALVSAPFLRIVDLRAGDLLRKAVH